MNELGRVLSALGPIGVSETFSKSKEEGVLYEKSVQGFASAMLGREDTSKVVELEAKEEPKEEELKEEPKEEQPAKKGTGKKNKKR